MSYLKIKGLLFLCGCFMLPYGEEVLSWLPQVLTAVILSAAAGQYDRRAGIRLATGIYLGLCIWNVGFLYLLPFVLYDFLCDQYEAAAILFLIPLFLHLEEMGISQTALIVVHVFIGRMLLYYSSSLADIQDVYLDHLDEAKESEKVLEDKNRYLQEKQEYEVRLATMDERNRIAREIHDNVGHMLSSSLIQIGALSAVTEDPDMKEHLGNIRETLSTGMDSIRHSIHNLHEDSVDLYARLQVLMEEFTFCEAVLDYNLSSEMNARTKYVVISVVKEALANVMKHSDATKVSVVLQEQPAFFQLIIQDNGTKRAERTGTGMGISSMEERIGQLQGNLTIRESKGYRLFISIPKGGNSNESINCG